MAFTNRSFVGRMDVKFSNGRTLRDADVFTCFYALFSGMFCLGFGEVFAFFSCICRRIAVLL